MSLEIVNLYDYRIVSDLVPSTKDVHNGFFSTLVPGTKCS